MATVHTANSRDGYTPDLRGDVSSLGGLLRRARERRGLTLQEIARETKLPQRHLEALEQDNLAVVPAGFYQRAEIRAYARAVGLDQNALLARLDSALKPAETREAERETSKSEEPKFPYVYALLALAIIAVAVVVFGRAISPRPPTLEGSTDSPVITDSLGKSDSPSSDEAPQPAVLGHDDSDSVARASVRTTSTASISTEPTGVQTSSVPVTTAEAVPPSPSADGATELIVTTEPAGARVTVNGIAWGISPVTIRHLPPGDKRIRVTKEGYAAVERVLRVDEGQRHALAVPLESTP